VLVPRRLVEVVEVQPVRRLHLEVVAPPLLLLHHSADSRHSVHHRLWGALPHPLVEVVVQLVEVLVAPLRPHSVEGAVEEPLPIAVEEAEVLAR